MLEPFEIFPEMPEFLEVYEEERSRATSPQPPSFLAQLRIMAQEATYFAEMWSEFPAVAAIHHSYARSFRAATSYRQGFLNQEALERRCRVQARRLAWQAYRIAAYPMVERPAGISACPASGTRHAGDPGMSSPRIQRYGSAVRYPEPNPRSVGRYYAVRDPGDLAMAAQQRKVDAYWASRLWRLLGGAPVRLSVLHARKFELQQLIDSQPYPAPLLSLSHLLQYISVFFQSLLFQWLLVSSPRRFWPINHSRR